MTPRSRDLRGHPPPPLGDQRRPGGSRRGSPARSRLRGLDFNAALMTADGRGLYCGVYIFHHGATIDEFVRRSSRSGGRTDARGRHVLHQRPVVGRAARERRHPREPDLLGGRDRRVVGHRHARQRRRQPRPRQLRRRVRTTASARRRCSRRSRWSRTSSCGRHRARLPAQPPHARAQRAEHPRPARLDADTHRRIHELIEQYGLEALQAAQEEIIDYVERVVRKRLRDMPDGCWTTRSTTTTTAATP